jgi:hypothetical protein
MSAYAYKFTDTHVRKHPALMAIAIEYIKAYEGDFEPMVEAKHTLLLTGSLNVAQTRKVLNTLRQDFDPDIASLQVEALSVLEDDEAARQAEVRRSEFKVVEPKPEKPKSAKRPFTIITKVSLKLPYAMPRVRQGAVHISVDAECRWELPWGYELHRMRPSERDKRRPTLWVYYRCGNYTFNPVLLLSEDEAQRYLNEEGRRRCVKCFPT